MRRCLIAASVALLLGSAARAQETRSMILGRVLDPSSAPVPGARVTLVNTATNAATRLVTNATGYYQAGLLLAGSYSVTAEADGFKKSIRENIELPVSTQLQVDLQLELGAVSESVSVTAEAPLLDVSSMSSGRVIDTRNMMDTPMPGGNVVLLTKLAPGVQSSDSFSDKTQRLHSNGGGSTYNTAGGVGGNEWSIDGTPDNGNGRNIAYMPVPEVIQEFKVETGGFDASLGHSTGINVAMMTRTGANAFHGTLRETHHQFSWDALSFFTKQSYYRSIAQAKAAGDEARAASIRKTSPQAPGRENNYVATLGGPVILPKIYSGKDKLFFFFGYAGFRVGSPRSETVTIPTMAAREGDFSSLLRVDATRYQVYDPLSVRPDPARPSHYVRDPFAGNIVPQSRISNPMYKFFKDVLPVPNDDPLDPKAEPLRNFIGFANPYEEKYYAMNNRVDYRVSDAHRVFVRWSANEWRNVNKTYMYASSIPDLASNSQIRNNVGAAADWVYVVNSSTMLNAAASFNTYRVENYALGALRYKPSDLGLPKYLDAKAGNNPILPNITWSGYDQVRPGGRNVTRYRFVAGKAEISHVRGTHSARAGLDFRAQVYTASDPGNNSGAFGFSNTYTRRDDDGSAPAGSLGLSWAAFMLGMPNSLSVDTNDSAAFLNPYYAWFVQDQWRVTPRLSLNLGLRAELEMGPTERYNRALGYFDPQAALPIAAAAQAAYAARPLAQLPASQFLVQGGSIYPGVGGAGRKLWNNALMWQPRVAAAYQLNSKTVLRGGYGVFYDTLNALNQSFDQTGFSRSTSSIMTTDYGVNWLLGNPKAGISPLTDPFPVRSDGARFDEPLRSALGVMAKAGRGWTFSPYDRPHARQQRWRAGVQRQIGGTLVIDASYSGSYSNHTEITRTLQPLAAQYWATGMVRNNAVASDLNSNVPNPFNIANFAALKNTQPQVYADMQTNSFFTSSTIRKNRLLRAYPAMNGLSARDAAGEVKTHEFDLRVERRFSKGFNLNLAYTRLYNVNADYYANEFDANPSWRPSDSGRPHRLTASGIYEFPFGRGRAFLKKGPGAWVLGGFQLSATYIYQPGELIDFGNLFFYGNLADINKGPRTLDRWFNTDGFERTSSKTPAEYHVRVFPTRINGLRSDMMNEWNSAVQRDFRIRESVSLRVRFDVMNTFNRSWFNGPGASPVSSDFGKVTSTSGSNRWVQIMARLEF
ncbi:MAG: carboxypeptidase regulatory-like domain-containing protein [Bryobacteraceae bacterium]